MWGVAVAMPYVFVVNEQWKWYNQMNKSKVVGDTKVKRKCTIFIQIKWIAFVIMALIG